MSLDFASELQVFEITWTLHATQKLQQRMRARTPFSVFVETEIGTTFVTYSIEKAGEASRE